MLFFQILKTNLSRPFATSPKYPKNYPTIISGWNIPTKEKKKKQLGRGEGGGKGKACGRGNKGYLHRSPRSRPVPGFEGGQTGLLRAIPKLGKKPTSPKLTPIRLDHIAQLIKTNRLVEGTIGIKELYSVGFKRLHNGCVLLANGASDWNFKVDFHVTRVTPMAARAVRKSGGSVNCVYFTKEEVRALLHPHKYFNAVETFNNGSASDMKSIPGKGTDM